MQDFVGGGITASPEISKEGEEGMQCVAESAFLQQAPGKDMCDPVRVQLKPHQRPKHVGDARMLNMWLGKLQAARENSSREVVWIASGKGPDLT